MAAKSGYERLTQVDEYDENSPLENSQFSNLSKSVAILSQPTRVHHLPSTSVTLNDHAFTTGHKGRQRSNSGIDIKAINARLERYHL